MRGKVGALAPEEPRPGITPAYAGKRSGPSCRWSSGRDHPRVCGEKKDAELVRRGETGITPAYAGKRRQIFS